MTIYERALELIPDGAAIGLGSGRAASAFVRLLGEKVRSGRLHVRAVPTSTETARIATENGIPLTDLNETSELAITIDGADEVDPDLNLIKGYGRALVREKVVAAASRLLVILVGEEKQVDQLGAAGDCQSKSSPSRPRSVRGGSPCSECGRRSGWKTAGRARPITATRFSIARLIPSPMPPV